MSRFVSGREAQDLGHPCIEAENFAVGMEPVNSGTGYLCQKLRSDPLGLNDSKV